MMERAILPLESAMALLDQTDAADPLQDLREYMLAGLRVTVEDPQARRVFEISTLKMEYVEELDAVRVRRQQSFEAWMTRAEGRIRLAQKRGQVKPSVTPRAAAIGMWVLVDGLIRNWLFDPSAFDLLAVGTEVIGGHIDGLRVH
jgi:TetR/AcrR family acrAB operon transcriptional repressor